MIYYHNGYLKRERITCVHGGIILIVTKDRFYRSIRCMIPSVPLEHGESDDMGLLLPGAY